MEILTQTQSYYIVHKRVSSAHSERTAAGTHGPWIYIVSSRMKEVNVDRDAGHRNELSMGVLRAEGVERSKVVNGDGEDQSRGESRARETKGH
jgi:hypothetical protein